MDNPKHITDSLKEQIINYRLWTVVILLCFLTILILTKEFVFDSSGIFTLVIFACIALATLVAAVGIYLRVAFKYWRCPYCSMQLPFETTTHSGLSPKTVDKCPNCKRGLIANN